MAHNQQTDSDSAESIAAATSCPSSGGKHLTDGEDLSADIDEPPDCQMNFSKMTSAGLHGFGSGFGSEPAQSMSPQYRKASLLTQAFTSPELGPLSDTEAPVLTSDGGITSPARSNTPSPPLPALEHTNFNPIGSKELLDVGQEQESVHLTQDLGFDRTQEVKIEEELGRRRCISFASFQKSTPRPTQEKAKREAAHPNKTNTPAAVPQKRPCTLRFACPMKPPHSEFQKRREARQDEESLQDKTSTQITIKAASPAEAALENSIQINPKSRESYSERGESNASKAGIQTVVSTSISTQDRILKFNRVDFQKSEATRFHEFAGSFAEEDEWANEQTAFRQKITINDTLRKENAIRKLAEEAEEEALEEEDDFYENADDSPDEASDDGNETDDEEGFADSDDESDGGSAYQFWTPGITTAATSAEHVEHARPSTHRTVSESSIESVVGVKSQRDESSQTEGEKVRKARRARKGTHPNPSDLLDSSDFVVGTIDEDQLFEETYLSRMKQKERSKQKLIPQDIDPSFPTSDPEAEGDDDDEAEEEDVEEKEATATDNDTIQTLHNVQSSDEHDSAKDLSCLSARKTGPNPSPRRLHSPPPSRRLFGQAIHHFRSPPPLHRKLVSPPSSRRPSLSESPSRTRGVEIARLAQRPNLTHTASLPRTPNPFWHLDTTSQYRELSTPSTGTSPKSQYPKSQDNHHRGPIEIVQGLENKRQRRKEKFWRQQCSKAHAGKDKERRCQPGKGAQRMREVGLVMADRFRCYKQDTKLVLSV